jgi:hypothetical protein
MAEKSFYSTGPEIGNQTKKNILSWFLKKVKQPNFIKLFFSFVIDAARK